MRVSRADGRLVELLIGDITGEHFTRIREGTPLDDELVWNNRVDRYAVIVDGHAYASLQSREVAVTRTKRLIHALRSSGQVARTSRIAIALTKEDALAEQDLEDYRETEQVLLTLARDVDPQASTLRIAARPTDHSPSRGLGDLVTWLCLDDRVENTTYATPQRPVRAIERFRS